MTLFFKLPTEQVSSTTGAVFSFIRISETSTLGSELTQISHIIYQSERAFNGLPLEPKPSRNGRSPFKPASLNLRRVEGCKRNVRRKPLFTVNDCPHSNFIRRIFVTESNPTSGMNFTVQVHIGKVARETARHLNLISGASPEGFSVPIGAASVQFFRGKPADQRALPNPILGQNYLRLINHKDIISYPGKM